MYIVLVYVLYTKKKNHRSVAIQGIETVQLNDIYVYCSAATIRFFLFYSGYQMYCTALQGYECYAYD